MKFIRFLFGSYKYSLYLCIEIKQNDMTDLKITPEKLAEYSPDLKDWLCRLYNFITKFEGKEGFAWVKLEQTSVEMAIRHLSIAQGYDSTNQKFASKFLANLDVMKELTENQPTTEVEYQYTYEGLNKELITSKEVVTFKTYDKDEMQRRINNEKGKHWTRKILSSK